MSVVHTVTRNHVEVIIRAAADCEGQGSFFCSGVNDCRLIVENERHRRLLCCPHPPRSKKTQPRQEGIEENSSKLR